MRGLLTGEDLFALILLLRTSDKRAVLILEGPTDCAVFDAHLQHQQCFSLPGYGKQSVLKAIELVDRTGLSNVIGVVDRDLDFIQGVDISSDNVIYTDAYDLDTTIFYASSTFVRVAASICERSAQESHLGSLDGRDARNLVESIAAPLSLLRMISERESLGLKLRGFPMHEVVDGGSASVRVKDLVRLAWQRSGSPTTIVLQDLVSEVEALLAQGLAGAQSICGHDLHASLSVIARASWGAPKSVGVDAVARLFRAAFSCTELMATELFAAIAAWADARSLTVWRCPTCS